MRACATQSRGVSWLTSCGCVCSQPRGSSPSSCGWFGSSAGSVTSWCVPCCGGITTASTCTFAAHARQPPRARECDECNRRGKSVIGERAHLLDLRRVGRRAAVEVARDLRAQVRDADELFENVLRQHVREATLLEVLRVDVDVVDAQVQVGGADCAHAPVRLAAKRLLHAAPPVRPPPDHFDATTNTAERKEGAPARRGSWW